MARKIAYLTMADHEDFVVDYALSFHAMADRGLATEEVPWRSPAVDWDRYTAVYICTPWDYPPYLDQFLAVLERIDESKALLVNDIDIVRWNLDKSYLLELACLGAPVVPSLAFESFAAEACPSWFSSLDTDRLVVKPIVGANAKDTFVIDRSLDATSMRLLSTAFARTAFLVQPFIESVQTQGEFSLFFFGGKYSHAIQKVPRPGDFRTQEEHGGDIKSFKAPAKLIAAAEHVLGCLQSAPVYVRADFVLDPEHGPLLMELEMVEPALYFRTDAHAASRFAAAFEQHLQASGRG